MSVLTAGIHSRLAGDGTLVGLLATYGDGAAVFTTDPAPADADLPYIVTAGEVVQTPADTKNSRGRDAVRDVRCYASATGSVVLIEAIAERARALLHRHELAIDDGYRTVVADVTGPIVADERDVYGRILSVRFLVTED
jgi:hypothetical protein